MPKKVSAAIVTFRGYEKARRAIESILHHTKDVELTLYVVDNASGDDTALRLAKEFPSISVLEQKINNGFGSGHNAVIPLLESDYHAVVNPDIVLKSDALSELAAYLDENGEVGIVTPRILNPDGSDQLLPKRDPTLCSLIGRRVFGGLLKAEVFHYQMLDRDLSQEQDIEFATGCFFMIRTCLFRELQGFDTRFFIYYEDMDITRRARGTMRAVYYPKTSVYHDWERSSAHSLKYFLILVCGMFKYFGKWGWRLRYPKREKANIETDSRKELP
ncbi:MAG: glycosyltransferase family 2 protein [Oscillospiraceae bacterium]|nr:glycosyltransferase family 2 protein [Oscillospiraceae bacterium]